MRRNPFRIEFFTIYLPLLLFVYKLGTAHEIIIKSQKWPEPVVKTLEDELADLELKIDTLEGKEEIRHAWCDLLRRDQENATGANDQKIFYMNLFESVLLFDKAGYPWAPNLGPPEGQTELYPYDAPWLTWRHVDNRDLLKFTYPMIHEGKGLKVLDPMFERLMTGYVESYYGLNFDLDKTLAPLKMVECETQEIKSNMYEADPWIMRTMVLTLLTAEKRKDEYPVLAKWSFQQFGNTLHYKLLKASDDTTYLAVDAGLGYRIQAQFETHKGDWEPKFFTCMPSLGIRNGQMCLLARDGKVLMKGPLEK